MNILITGHSSGLGKSLAEKFFLESHNVYGISKSKGEHAKEELICDFSQPDLLSDKIEDFIKNLDRIDYIFLNAGKLGQIKKIEDSDVQSLMDIFSINLLPNKILIDRLLKNKKMPTKSVIAISSGAALKPKYGWFEYCVSKSALKMLIDSYAIENPELCFYSLAPGLIKTKMQKQIKQIDPIAIPSVEKFHQLYDKMDSPKSVAEKIYNFLPRFADFPSGEFIDLRNYASSS